MKIADIKSKSMSELTELLLSQRKQLALAIIEMRTKQVQNVKQTSAIKKTIARIQTTLREQEITKLEQTND